MGSRRSRDKGMALTDAFDEYVYAHTPVWRGQSREWIERTLKRFIHWAVGQGVGDTSGLTAILAHKHIEAMRAEGLSSYTIVKYAVQVKSWMKWLSAEDLGVEEREVKRYRLPKADKVIKQTVEQSEYRMLLDTAAKAPGREGPRNVALLSLLLDTGIRASELANLKLADVNLSREDAFVTVMGKGRKMRECGIGRATRSALVRYIHQWRLAKPGVEEVFTGRTGELLGRAGVGAIVRRTARKAGYGRILGPHKLRHSFARTYLANGGDVLKLSRLLGHESLNITQLYVQDLRMAEARQGASVLDMAMNTSQKGR